jgi:hypothetical protein
LGRNSSRIFVIRTFGCWSGTGPRSVEDDLNLDLRNGSPTIQFKIGPEAECNRNRTMLV